MKGFKEIKEKKDKAKEEIESRKQLGEKYEKDKESYDKLYSDIYEANLNDEDKNAFLSEIVKHKVKLQKSYEENVSEPIEKQNEIMDELNKETTKNIENLQEAYLRLESYKNITDVDLDAIDAARGQVSEKKKDFEKVKREMISQKDAVREILQQQRNEIYKNMGRNS